MYYLKLANLDQPASVFDICQAHLQLEADYNLGGWLNERPSNLRRNASTGVQLHRMGYSPGMRWVDILSDENAEEDDVVRDIYLRNVLKLNLPIDTEMRAFMLQRYTPEFLTQYPSFH